MEITLLGTGTPTPSLQRASSSYLIKIDNDVLLFDFGPGAYHRMMEAGVSPTEVTHIFFSHLHYDHCVDFARLVLTRWDHGADKIPPLKVYGPPPVAAMSDRLFGENGAFEPDITARIKNPSSCKIYQNRGGTLPRRGPSLEIHELRGDDTVKGDNWKIQTAEVAHMQPYLTPLAYRIQAGGKTVVYAGDTGPCDAIETLAQGCDVLIVMCQCISGKEPSSQYAADCMGHIDLARLGQKTNARILVVSHIHAQLDVPGVRERLIAEMCSEYKGCLIWGEDLMEIPFAVPTTDEHV